MATFPKSDRSFSVSSFFAVLFTVVSSASAEQNSRYSAEPSLKVAFHNIFVVADIFVFAEGEDSGGSGRISFSYPHFVPPQQVLIHQQRVVSGEEELRSAFGGTASQVHFEQTAR